MNNLHCACLIHGNLYDWIYVERLYNMLTRNSEYQIKLHVYTEENRPVPDPYIKHSLTDWNIAGPKKAWWYKLQLFNDQIYNGNLLYFDLDTVIVSNIDWITELSTEYFWAVHDFKRLWRPTHNGINSSVMWWNTKKYNYVWTQANIEQEMLKYRGDQDYISECILATQRCFFDTKLVKSWRWQAFDGGYDFARRKHLNPGSGTNIKDTSILVFHGNPKPNEVQDTAIIKHWQ